jgi:hypothetical protein
MHKLIKIMFEKLRDWLRASCRVSTVVALFDVASSGASESTSSPHDGRFRVRLRARPYSLEARPARP